MFDKKICFVEEKWLFVLWFHLFCSINNKITTLKQLAYE